LSPNDIFNPKFTTKSVGERTMSIKEQKKVEIVKENLLELEN